MVDAFAPSAKFWICSEGHLHVRLENEDGSLIAQGAVDIHNTIEVVFKLAEQLDELYEGEGDEEVVDTIGPTVGNA